MGRTDYNVSGGHFIVSLASVVNTTGNFINWDAVDSSDVDANGDKVIKAGTIVALKNGGVFPRKDSAITLSGATETGGTGTYTASAAHGLKVGDIVDITGFTTGGYNVAKAKVATVPSTTTFTVTGLATLADDNGGGTATSRAFGILLEGITQSEKNRALNGQAVIKGGVIYDSLLPDSGESGFDTFKTELQADCPMGFQFEEYSDSRAS